MKKIIATIMLVVMIIGMFSGIAYAEDVTITCNDVKDEAFYRNALIVLIEKAALEEDDITYYEYTFKGDNILHLYVECDDETEEYVEGFEAYMRYDNDTILAADDLGDVFDIHENILCTFDVRYVRGLDRTLFIH